MKLSEVPKIIRDFVASSAEVATSSASGRSRKEKLVALATAATLVTGWGAVKIVDSSEFALTETIGIGISDIKGPGVHFQVPFAQVTHAYRAKTQSFEFGAGSNRFFPWDSNTSDRNVLVADVQVDYRVMPDAQKLAFWRWKMRDWFTDKNGYWLLTDMANISANAVLGNKSMAETLSKPEEFARKFYQDLTARLDTNNIPVQIQSVELKGIRTTFWPAHDRQYSRVIGAQNSASPAP